MQSISYSITVKVGIVMSIIHATCRVLQINELAERLTGNSHKKSQQTRQNYECTTSAVVKASNIPIRIFLRFVGHFSLFLS